MMVDFHMHTTYSDGRMTAKDLVLAYYKAGFRYISITDHDEIGAIKELGKHPYPDLYVVPGIEFSSTYKGKDVHILGYNYDVQNKVLQEYVSFYKECRHTRIIKMIDKAIDLGIDISYDDLKGKFGENVAYGRPHLAQLLIDKGYVQDIPEAFASLLSSKGKIYVPKFTVTPKDVLDIIKTAGGISVLAHPILINNDEEVRELLALPFDGLEVYHTKHDKVAEESYKKMAEEFHLLISGGSDYHALPNRYPEKVGEYVVNSENVSAFMRKLNLGNI